MAPTRRRDLLSNNCFILLCLSLFIILQFSAVHGGVCWSTVTVDGRCTDAIDRSLTNREDCCRIAGGLGAWTDEDYDSAQTFFWSALGGGAPNCKACSNACNGIKCLNEQVCSLRNGRPHCACPTHCPSSTTPVCSVEGITYRSECHMKKRNCRLRNNDYVSYEGYCQHSCETVKCRDDQHCIVDNNHQPYCVRCMTNCPDLYVPMCGTDGVTYNSMCELNRAACNNKHKDIKYAHRGACNVSASCSDVKCTGSESCFLDVKQNVPRCIRCDLNCSESLLEAQVCGSDGITYSSWCQLRTKSCASGVLIHVKRIGACSTPPETQTR